MRLLDVETQRLKEFSSADRPKYAILSHRWFEPNSDEVSYEDIIKDDLSEVKKKRGWEKIVKTCEMARAAEPSIKWVWIDTCCINKSSSTELAEALNSMFMWYQEAERCIVWLWDVEAGKSVEGEKSSFWKSDWFKRGWTLQELIAPKEVIFYSKTWTKIGDRAALHETITKITNIEKDVLMDSKVHLSKVSVARRMSWTVNRETKKPEDMAYSLIGIFGVTLTPVYGEGMKAFRRLQIEIVKVSNDQSLFAWSYVPGEHDYDGTMFAPHPYCFQDSSDIVQVDFRKFKKEFTLSESVTDYAVTNEGLRIRLPIVTDNAFRATTEQIARPYKFAKEISGMKRTIKRMRGTLAFSETARSLAQRRTIRAYLACKFDKERNGAFVSIPLTAMGSGHYSRRDLKGGVEDLIYQPIRTGIAKALFYTIQCDTLYITKAEKSWSVAAVANSVAQAKEKKTSKTRDTFVRDLTKVLCLPIYLGLRVIDSGERS